MNGNGNSPAHRYPEKGTWMRRLALAKLRELRQAGLSYREIAARFGRAPRTPPLASRRTFAHGGSAVEIGPGRGDEAIFLRTLDALEQRLVFFDCEGTLFHTTYTLSQILEASPEGERLGQEIHRFADRLCGLIHTRKLRREEGVQDLAVREVPAGEECYRLRGSYIGMDLFGSGGVLLIRLERPAPEPLPAKVLRERFGLTPQESCIAHLLAKGKTNQEIAKVLCISPHTARTHTKRILHKLDVQARAEVAARVLTRDGT